MILYLTSDMGGVSERTGAPVAVALKKENKFAQNVKRDLDEMYPVNEYPELNCLVLSADPDNHRLNDCYSMALLDGFALTGLRIKHMDICDSRGIVKVNAGTLCKKMNEYQVLFMMGGHAPDQNEFFQKIGLKEKLADYDGLILALSAGSMNCADVTYCIPEYDNELDFPANKRFASGLGLTSYQIVPHFQYLKTITLGGKKLIEDIVLKDSFGHNFTALCDGSYIRIVKNDSHSTLFGEGYEISDGQILKM